LFELMLTQATTRSKEGRSILLRHRHHPLCSDSKFLGLRSPPGTRQIPGSRAVPSPEAEEQSAVARLMFNFAWEELTAKNRPFRYRQATVPRRPRRLFVPDQPNVMESTYIMVDRLDDDHDDFDNQTHLEKVPQKF
jgi:hypothetical protein